MNVLLVRNPGAGSAAGVSTEELARALAHLGAVAVLEPPAVAALRSGVGAAAARADVVAVAGGDGTFGEVVNALADRLDELRFALLPSGTGNDLARTLGLPDDALAAARVLDPGRVRRLDVGRIETESVRRLFVNACMGGFPVDVDEAIGDDSKRRLGPLAFWVGGLKAAVGLRRATVYVDGREVRDCVAVGVGIGRSVGGGIEVWPEADPSDGLLDVCALGAPGASGAARLALRVARGAHDELESVFTARAGRVALDADPPIEFNVDGELVGAATPAVFAHAGTISVVVPATVSRHEGR